GDKFKLDALARIELHWRMRAKPLLGVTRRRLAFTDPGRRPATIGRLDDLTIEQRIADLDRSIIRILSAVGYCDRERTILTARCGGASAGRLGDGQVSWRGAECPSALFEWRELGLGEGRVVAGFRVPIAAAGGIDDLGLVLVAAPDIRSCG